ncbi:ATP-binding protein [Agromyces sp. Marseille-Q5079]|uniref:ATP-binding protein n=1 Tax=Agromyces sp. Marseille-Q5079 TaxID=3439059 RepID=UPI003D9CA2CE
MELADLATGLRADGARSLLIDGRSGSGKSTIATALAALWPEAVVIRLDSIYPGWGGLAWASEHLRASVLEPRALGLAASWREWDWSSGSVGGWHPVDADRPLIIEGVGSLTIANRALADAALWVEHDTAERKARALARDGETYAPHWDAWAAQEDVFIAQNTPEALADLIAVPADGGFDLMQTGRTP